MDIRTIIDALPPPATLYPPEAFRADSSIGRALAARSKAEATHAALAAQRIKAEADLSTAQSLVSGANLLSDMAKVSEATLQAQVLTKMLPAAREAEAEALRELEQARNVFNNVYGAYSSVVQMQPFDLPSVQNLKVAEWLDMIRATNEQRADFETGLKDAK